MPTFLERYASGEHQQVWDDLLRLGADVRHPAVVNDARAVALETMRRAKENVGRLVTRLAGIGFRFAYEPDDRTRAGSWWGDSQPVHEPPPHDTALLLDDLERTVGPLPLSLRAWWEIVGSVNLIGTHPDWPPIEVIDPLVVGPVEMVNEAKAFHEEWLQEQEWVEEIGEEERQAEPLSIDIAPDNYHKANYSGGPPYAVEFPCRNADGLFNGGPDTFVQYLRNAFRWGGFPGFQNVDPARRPSEHLAHLANGLLSI